MTANLRGQCIDSGRKRIKEEKTKRRRPYAEFLKRRYREEDSTFRTPRLGQFKNAGETVPTVYETCEENRIEIEDLEALFPDGYHRGAVKISGLRVR